MVQFGGTLLAPIFAGRRQTENRKTPDYSSRSQELRQISCVLPYSLRAARFRLQLPPISTMDAELQQPKGRDGVLSALNVAIEILNLAKEICPIPPAKAVFGAVRALLTMVRVRFLLSCT
jgi:hypothetical protein